jgi:hypothetical protein
MNIALRKLFIGWNTHFSWLIRDESQDDPTTHSAGRTTSHPIVWLTFKQPIPNSMISGWPPAVSSLQTPMMTATLLVMLEFPLRMLIQIYNAWMAKKTTNPVQYLYFVQAWWTWDETGRTDDSGSSPPACVAAEWSNSAGAPSRSSWSGIPPSKSPKGIESTISFGSGVLILVHGSSCGFLEGRISNLGSRWGQRHFGTGQRIQIGQQRWWLRWTTGTTFGYCLLSLTNDKKVLYVVPTTSISAWIRAPSE